MLRQPWIGGIRAIYSSPEQKAVGGAEILAQHLGLPFTPVAELGEVDRSHRLSAARAANGLTLKLGRV